MIDDEIVRLETDYSETVRAKESTKRAARSKTAILLTSRDFLEKQRDDSYEYSYDDNVYTIDIKRAYCTCIKFWKYDMCKNYVAVAFNSL